MESVCIELASLDQSSLERLALAMVNSLPKPLVIGLVGTLGAGKTTLVQAIARAAGIDSNDVTSPTFTLLQSHRGTITLHHLDAYRLGDEEEFLELGVEELFEEENAWVVVEWADRVATVLPPGILWIQLSIESDPSRRHVAFITSEPSLQALCREIVHTERDQHGN